MSGSGARHIFAGNGTGAAARFHRLDDVENLNHMIPAQGSAALAPTGGRSEARVDSHFEYRVDHPRPRRLLAVDRAHTWLEGRDAGGRLETEVSVDVEGMEVLEKLRVDSIRLHMLATRTAPEGVAVVTTSGNRVVGLRMGKVEARITLDDEPLTHTGSQKQLEEFWRGQSDDYRRRNAWRFYTKDDEKELADDYGQYRFSLVSGIVLSGLEKDQADISVDGYAIRWKGFGRIILGEVHVKGQERRVSLVRLAMGSDGGGDGTGGGGGSNGSGTAGS